MSRTSPVHCRTIEIDAGEFPSPATKLVITQHLEASADPPFWAWLIVDIELDSEDESDTDSSSDSETSEGQEVTEERQNSHSVTGSPYSDIGDRRENTLNWHFQNQHFQTGLYQPIGQFDPATSSILPPASWDPTRQGPVPGYWQASFDPVSRCWVHTWQPFY
ncbi:hypothetical protein BGZ63DRAFT_427022 [Mariannaea sp. PMI_226]|nr:hypothetical protein BGZ63DRAFT_427022 [Mariannaea sp. PMI_226]